MLNLNAEGKIDVNTSEGAITRLSWNAQIDLDPVALIKTGGNLSDEALLGSMIHISLYIDPADNEVNKTFIETRNACEQTNILDLVYDPANTKKMAAAKAAAYWGVMSAGKLNEQLNVKEMSYPRPSTERRNKVPSPLGWEPFVMPAPRR